VFVIGSNYNPSLIFEGKDGCLTVLRLGKLQAWLQILDWDGRG